MTDDNMQAEDTTSKVASVPSRPGKSGVTYEEIAAAAGVSTATVSRALSGSARVSDKRKKLVLATAEKLSYRPSRPARALRRQQADMIGLIVADVEYPLVASMARDVERACAERGLAVSVCNSDESLSREKTYIELMLEEKAAGVIISPATEDANVLAPLLDAGIPVVAVDRLVNDPRVDAVLLDNKTATEMLMEELIRDGHRHFLAVMGTTTATPSRERLEAMEEIVRSQHGATLEVVGQELRQTVGVGRTLSTLGVGVVDTLRDLSPMPTAVLCANAIMLTSVMAAFKNVGIEVPRQVAVVGYDDMAGFDLFSTPVTVVNQPVGQMGQKAVAYLFERMNAPGKRSRRIERITPELLLRKSCGIHV